MMLFYFFSVEGQGYDLLEESFFDGDFRSFRTKATKPATGMTATLLVKIAEEPSTDSDEAAGLYSCAQSGFFRVI